MLFNLNHLLLSVARFGSIIRLAKITNHNTFHNSKLRSYHTCNVRNMDYTKWDNVDDSIASEIGHALVATGLDNVDCVYSESRKYSIV